MLDGANSQVRATGSQVTGSWGQRGTVGPVFAGNVEVRDVAYEAGDRAILNGVSFSLKAGEIGCLLGASGCGKSTLLRIIAGLVPQSRGLILLDQVTVAGPASFIPPEKRSIGLMFQDFALFPHLTVLQNVMFGLYAVPRGDALRTAENALARVGLFDLRHQYPATLSGGEQQRVALARTIVPRPQIVLMDEPFSGLDQRLREQIRGETMAILREMRATALLVTHDPEEALEVADKIILMRKGGIVQSGAPFSVFDHPADLDAARFFSSADEFAGVAQAGFVETPLGPVAAPGVPNGTGVTVVLRAGAVTESKGPRSVLGRVVGLQRKGRNLLARMQLEGQAGSIAVQFEGLNSVKLGDARSLVLQPGQAAAFETTSGRPI
jgi:iron(III) transport system ATP-binding protein